MRRWLQRIARCNLRFRADRRTISPQQAAHLSVPRCDQHVCGRTLKKAARDKEWSFNGVAVCDGADPEGNVVQFREIGRQPGEGPSHETRGAGADGARRRGATLRGMAPRIRGLQYIPDYLDVAAHDRLLTDVDSQPWLTSVGHRVQIYGYNYNRQNQSAFRIGDLPPWVTGLAARLCDDGLLAKVPNQMVANDYQPGTGIFAHTDQDAFGESVASVSLGSGCVMRFSHDASGRTEDVLLEPRSVIVLTDDARWAWRHEIPARIADTWLDVQRPRSRRVSLTFRVVP